MSLADLEDAFRIIDANGELADFEGVKEEALIAAAERKLGVAFPKSYRRFLKRYGAGDIAGEEIYGVVNDDFDNSGIPDAVWITLDERGSSALPADLVLVYATGMGPYYALRCSKATDDRECPLVVWSPGLRSDDELPIVFEDFGQFLKEILEDAI